MATSTRKQFWRNNYFQTAITIILIFAIVFGFWYGTRLVLNTDYPILAVATGSMCRRTLAHSYCDGWSHPFERTLHVGDLIIVQGVSPEEIHAAPYPTGDIIVFHYGDDLLVHRAIEKIVENGHISFVTQGDGNHGPGPGSPTPASAVVGKVILRIPWAGHLALLMGGMRAASTSIIIALVCLLIILEFAIPLFTDKKAKTKQEENAEKASET